MRGGVRVGFVGLSLVAGCGLSLSIEPLPGPSTDGGVEADATSSPRDVTPPPPPPDAEVPDTAPPPPPPLTFEPTAAAPLAFEPAAVALDAADNLFALSFDGTTAELYDVTSGLVAYAFVPTGKPTSILPIATAAGTLRSLFAVPTVGLFALTATGPTAYPARTDAARVFGRKAHVYVASQNTPSTPGGTKVMQCAATFPDAEDGCDVPKLVYDASALAGFAVSPDDRALVGLVGTGPTTTVSVFTRADTTANFATARPVAFPPGALAGAIAIVKVSDDLREVRIHGPCTTAPSGCVTTFTAKP